MALNSVAPSHVGSELWVAEKRANQAAAALGRAEYRAAEHRRLCSVCLACEPCREYHKLAFLVESHIRELDDREKRVEAARLGL